jgi:methanogenic corrinoid protein MtbC1
VNAFQREDGIEDTSGGWVFEMQTLVDTPAQHGRMSRPSDLDALVHSRVIPDLVRAYRNGAPQVRAPCGLVSQSDTADFAKLVLLGNLDAAVERVEKLRDTGLPLERILLDILVPAARNFGNLWASDRCDFTEVTVGCWRLQQIMRRCEHDMYQERTFLRKAGSILLSAAPGEQHTFGLEMLAGFFRRAGYHVLGGPGGGASAIVEAVRSQHVDVIGLSVAGDCRIKGLAALICSLRKVSANRRVRVLIGGAAVLSSPDVVQALGADGWADDALGAIAVVDSWCEQKAF